MAKKIAQEMSILQLGTSSREIRKNWQKIKDEETIINLKESPKIDIYQIIDKEHKIDLMGFFIDMLERIEQRNKEIAKKRQAEGILRAREEGIQLGRRPLEIPEDFEKTYLLIKDKKIRVTTAARLLDVDYKTIKKWIVKYEEEQDKKEIADE